MNRRALGRPRGGGPVNQHQNFGDWLAGSPAGEIVSCGEQMRRASSLRSR